MIYQNVLTSRNSATFINMDGEPYEITFKSQAITPTIGGVAVPMVKYSGVVRLPGTYQHCNDDCGLDVIQSIKIEFSLLKDTNQANMQAELLRLVSDAIDNYNLTRGFVPPVSATFTAE